MVEGFTLEEVRRLLSLVPSIGSFSSREWRNGVEDGNADEESGK